MKKYNKIIIVLTIVEEKKSFSQSTFWFAKTFIAAEAISTVNLSLFYFKF